jgi:hypothetical protein
VWILPGLQIRSVQVTPWSAVLVAGDWSSLKAWREDHATTAPQSRAVKAHPTPLRGSPVFLLGVQDLPASIPTIHRIPSRVQDMTSHPPRTSDVVVEGCKALQQIYSLSYDLIEWRPIVAAASSNCSRRNNRNQKCFLRRLVQHRQARPLRRASRLRRILPESGVCKWCKNFERLKSRRMHFRAVHVASKSLDHRLTCIMVMVA